MYTFWEADPRGVFHPVAQSNALENIRTGCHVATNPNRWVITDECYLCQVKDVESNVAYADWRLAQCPNGAAIVRAAAKAIFQAELALGRTLDFGERSDLILDNMAAVNDSNEAHAIVRAIARTTREMERGARR